MGRKKLDEVTKQAESDLRYWGFHVGKQYAADGYPGSSTLVALLAGHSDLNPLAPKFGVNLVDIPPEAWQINAVVMRLRAELRAVLLARYALPMNYATGQPIEASVIVDVLELKSVRFYRGLLQQAREQFFRLKAGGDHSAYSYRLAVLR